MNFARTTLRLDVDLKRAAEKQAVEESTTLQAIFNDALSHYLDAKAKKTARKILFRSHDLGKPLDNLRRGDYYAKP